VTTGITAVQRRILELVYERGLGDESLAPELWDQATASDVNSMTTDLEVRGIRGNPRAWQITDEGRRVLGHRI
jgi:hypothetical protein